MAHVTNASEIDLRLCHRACEGDHLSIKAC
jgi:hypothetical protein